jgi:predicted AAA+ superfamily ATPase
MANHGEIAKRVCSVVKPMAYFQDYLHHGFYPFFLEKRNFSENLLKTMNMMLEVDVLYIKQIEQTYLPKLRKLLYLLAILAPCTPNVSQLSKEIETSRATVMNYMKYLTDARLINILYPVSEEFPKKPSKVYMYNPNLIYPIRPEEVNAQAVRETFFFNQMRVNNKVYRSEKSDFNIHNLTFEVGGRSKNQKQIENLKNAYIVKDDVEHAYRNTIPLWAFGLVY